MSPLHIRVENLSADFENFIESTIYAEIVSMSMLNESISKPNKSFSKNDLHKLAQKIEKSLSGSLSSSSKRSFKCNWLTLNLKNDTKNINSLNKKLKNLKNYYAVSLSRDRNSNLIIFDRVLKSDKESLIFVVF